MPFRSPLNNRALNSNLLTSLEVGTFDKMPALTQLYVASKEVFGNDLEEKRLWVSITSAAIGHAT